MQMLLISLLLALDPQTPAPTPAKLAAEVEEWGVSEGDEGAAFGRSVTQVKDLDGDGVPDIVIGSFDRAATLPTTRFLTDVRKPVGRLFAYSWTKRKQLWSCSWKDSCIAFGECVATIPDQDGDGVDDLAVGLTDMSISGLVTKALNGSGVAIVSAKRGVVMKEMGLDCEEVLAIWWAPSRLNASAGDLICGVTEKGRSGRIVDLSPRTGKVLWRSPSLPFARSYARIDCLSPDAVTLIAVGCPDLDGDTPHKEKVLVLSAETGKVIDEIAAPGEHEEFGTAVCSVGDIDGDSKPDMAIGAPEARKGENAVGSVYLWGSRERKVLRSLAGSEPASRFGASLAWGTRTGRSPPLALYVVSFATAKPGIVGSIAIADVSEAKVLDTVAGTRVWCFPAGTRLSGWARTEDSASYDPKAAASVRIVVQP